jgi:hypothetical protein
MSELIELIAFQMIQNNGKKEAIKMVEFKIELHSEGMNQFSSKEQFLALNNLNLLLDELRTISKET